MHLQFGAGPHSQPISAAAARGRDPLWVGPPCGWDTACYSKPFFSYRRFERLWRHRKRHGRIRGREHPCPAWVWCGWGRRRQVLLPPRTASERVLWPSCHALKIGVRGASFLPLMAPKPAVGLGAASHGTPHGTHRKGPGSGCNLEAVPRTPPTPCYWALLKVQEAVLHLPAGTQTECAHESRAGYDSDKLVPNSLAPGAAHLAR